MIAAILRAQWLSMRFGGRSSIAGAVSGLLWYGLWFFAGCAAWWWTEHATPATLGFYLPIGLLLVCFYWQLVPILSASMGASLDMRKLLAYPIPHGSLFVVEVLLRLTTSMEMVLVLAGTAVGLIANPHGGWTAAPSVLASIAILALFNLLLSSGMRSILERLLARRKVREFMAVVMVCVWMAPRLLVESGFHLKSLGPAAPVIQAFGLPWTAAAHAALQQSALSSLLALSAWTLLAGWFGRRQFERGLRYDAIAAQATPLTARRSGLDFLRDRFYRLPGVIWRDPLAAIVEKELRTLARTPRFRMVFVMGFTFGLMMWVPMVIGRHGNRQGALAHYFLTVVCAYSLTLIGQVTYWNCFGFDRSAASLYFAAPQPIGAVLVGKNIASLVFIYLELAILTAITLVLGMLTGWEQWIEAVVVIGICSLYVLAIGNYSSVQYPRALHAERVSQGGSSSRFQGILLLFYPVALLPVVLAYLARYAFDSPLAFWVALVFAAAIGATVYWLGLESAVKTAGRRREQILQDLSQGDGPVISG
jgi:ABC-2 type transport system permease protein